MLVMTIIHFSGAGTMKEKVITSTTSTSTSSKPTLCGRAPRHGCPPRRATECSLGEGKGQSVPIQKEHQPTNSPRSKTITLRLSIFLSRMSAMVMMMMIVRNATSWWHTQSILQHLFLDPKATLKTSLTTTTTHSHAHSLPTLLTHSMLWWSEHRGRHCIVCIVQY